MKVKLFYVQLNKDAIDLLHFSSCHDLEAWPESFLSVRNAQQNKLM